MLQGSVLRPFVFTLYVNYPEDRTGSQGMKFAEDAKMEVNVGEGMTAGDSTNPKGNKTTTNTTICQMCDKHFVPIKIHNNKQ